ncbi:hypothetical protein DFH09DRAFT_1185495 [Mycena vulgaris]|nr:hypothetical protein DFH09DRAFT_1185495 [Mycena vulgaris]
MVECKVRALPKIKVDRATGLLSGGPPESEMKQIKDVLANAFARDKFTAGVIGIDPEETVEPKDLAVVVPAHRPIDSAAKSVTYIDYIGTFWLTTVTAGLLSRGGEVFVAETEGPEPQIIGCAVWFGPGYSMYDSTVEQEHALGPLLGLFDEPLQKWWHGSDASFLATYGKLVGSALGGVDTEGGLAKKEASWHLQTLGVHPDHQGKGVGTRLVGVTVEQAKSEGKKLCLEVENTKKLQILYKAWIQIHVQWKGGRCQAG